VNHVISWIDRIFWSLCAGYLVVSDLYRTVGNVPHRT